MMTFITELSFAINFYRSDIHIVLILRRESLSSIDKKNFNWLDGGFNPILHALRACPQISPWRTKRRKTYKSKKFLCIASVLGPGEVEREATRCEISSKTLIFPRPQSNNSRRICRHRKLFALFDLPVQNDETGGAEKTFCLQIQRINLSDQSWFMIIA